MQSTQDLIAEYHENGFVILRDVISPPGIAALRSALQPFLDLDQMGRNDFEGERTRRVYSLVGRGSIFEPPVEHPAVLALLDVLLQPGYLLTASQAICIYPGETPQPLHADDAFYTLPRPRPAISVSTIWALDDFTAVNGGTELIPGSHTWNQTQVEDVYTAGYEDRLMPLEMSAGSLVLFAGTLLHRGGGNTSGSVRRAFSHQYCEPWARQQENFCLSVPKSRARGMTPRVRELLGYSILPPFMGQIAGRHPEKTLSDGYINSLIADDDEIAKKSGETLL